MLVDEEYAGYLLARTRSADPVLAEQARSVLATAVGPVLAKNFNPAEPRDERGRWTLLGAIEHEIGKLGDVKPEGKDRLKLADRIHLEPGEKLVGSAKLDTDRGNVRLAGIEKDGQRHLRLGTGNEIYGTRHDEEEGVWTGNRSKLPEENARRAALRAEEKDLEDRWGDEADPAERQRIEARLGELGDTDTMDLYPAGHTTHLDPAQARELHDTLAGLLPQARRVEDELRAPYDEIDRLEAEKDKLKEAGGGRKWTPEEDARWDQLDAQIKDLERQGQAQEWQVQIGQGVIPGRWGDVHYDVYHDEPAQGSRFDLKVVPHGTDPDEVSDESAGLATGDVAQLLKHLDELT